MKMTVTFEFNSLSEAHSVLGDILLQTPAKKTSKTEVQPKKTPRADAADDGVRSSAQESAPVIITPTITETGTVGWEDIEIHLGDNAKGLGKRQREVVEHLYNLPSREAKTREVSDALGIGSSAASNILSTLHSERGLTESIKRGVWRLVVNEQPEAEQPEAEQPEAEQPEAAPRILSLDDLDI